MRIYTAIKKRNTKLIISAIFITFALCFSFQNCAKDNLNQSSYKKSSNTDLIYYKAQYRLNFVSVSNFPAGSMAPSGFGSFHPSDDEILNSLKPYFNSKIFLATEPCLELYGYSCKIFKVSSRDMFDVLIRNQYFESVEPYSP
jgi:hypothetical protein